MSELCRAGLIPSLRGREEQGIPLFQREPIARHLSLSYLHSPWVPDPGVSLPVLTCLSVLVAGISMWLREESSWLAGSTQPGIMTKTDPVCSSMKAIMGHFDAIHVSQQGSL